MTIDVQAISSKLKFSGQNPRVFGKIEQLYSIHMTCVGGVEFRLLTVSAN